MCNQACLYIFYMEKIFAVSYTLYQLLSTDIGSARLEQVWVEFIITCTVTSNQQICCSVFVSLQSSHRNKKAHESIHIAVYYLQLHPNYLHTVHALTFHKATRQASYPVFSFS